MRGEVRGGRSNLFRHDDKFGVISGLSPARPLHADLSILTRSPEGRGLHTDTVCPSKSFTLEVYCGPLLFYWSGTHVSIHYRPCSSARRNMFCHPRLLQDAVIVFVWRRLLFMFGYGWRSCWESIFWRMWRGFFDVTCIRRSCQRWKFLLVKIQHVQHQGVISILCFFIMLLQP